MSETTIKRVSIVDQTQDTTVALGADAQNVDVGILSGSIVEEVVYGYKIADKFYEKNNTTSTEIIGEADKVYLDLNDNKKPYIYDTSLATPAFVAVETGLFENEKLSSILKELGTKESVSWEQQNILGAKNFIPTGVTQSNVNGITFTVNTDGSIQISGTATNTAVYTIELPNAINEACLFTIDYLSGSSTILNTLLSVRLEDALGNTISPYFNGNPSIVSPDFTDDGTAELSIAANSNIKHFVITVNNGANFSTSALIKPMLRLNSIKDRTYVPYAMTNKELTEEIADATDDLLKEVKTRGQLGAKNLLPISINTQTSYNGVTVINNHDGTYTLNGTCTADASYSIHNRDKDSDFLANIGTGTYILNGYPSGKGGKFVFHYRKADDSGWADGYDDTGNGVSIPYDGTKKKYTIYLLIKSGDSFDNYVFKPMLRLATDLDDTYQPYARTNQELTGEVEPMLNVLGAKNIFPNKAKSQTVSGVAFTVNEDGTITANGTYTSRDPYVLSNGWHDTDIEWIKALEGKRVTISGGLQHVSFAISFMDSAGNELLALGTDYNGGTGTGIIPSGVAQYSSYLYPNSLATFSNAVFKPMMRLASIQDSTYVPYTMTNQQLTPYALSQSNPNLLDNPWFTVNQRGQSSYTNTWQYCLDRWYLANATSVVINNDGTITINGKSDVNSLIFEILDEQLVTKLTGEKVTISVLMSDGTIISKTGIFTNNNYDFIRKDDTNYHIAIDLSNTGTGGGTEFRIKTLDANNITIRAAKLELGSVSTLANDTTPNYGSELLKCQTSTANSSDVYDTYANRNTSGAALMLEQTQSLSTGDDTVYIFTNNLITNSSTVDVYTDIYGINPSDVEITNGQCVVTFPSQSEAQTMTCRIYIK